MNPTPSPAVAGCSGGVPADEAGPEERLRIALLNVDYVTSFELPFRLLLTRTPQLIAALREGDGTSARKMWCSTINALAACTT